jgi:hypothetical protein
LGDIASRSLEEGVSDTMALRPQMLTLRLSIGAPGLLGNSFEPSLLNSFETAIALEKVLAADVDRAVMLAKGDASSASEEYNAHQEEEEKEEERRKDNEER